MATQTTPEGVGLGSVTVTVVVGVVTVVVGVIGVRIVVDICVPGLMVAVGSVV